MNQASLAQRRAHGALHRADQPGCPVADHEQRAGQAPLAEVGEEPGPGVPGLAGGRVEAEDRLAVGVDPQAASTGSTAAFAWYLKCDPSKNR